MWPVKRGDRTPRGAALVTAMWGDLGEGFRKEGILPPNLCQKPADVFVRADTDERTRATARALLDALAPDCRLGFAVSTDAIDPLFHPVKAGLYTFDPIGAATDILSMTDGGLGQLQDDLATPLALVGRLSAPVSPELCGRFNLPQDCALSDIPNAVSVAPDGRNVNLTGSLAIASSLAEIFLLEYGEWPGIAAGWGQVTAPTLRKVLPVHARVFDVVNRAPLVAWARGSSLLAEMGAALLGTHYDERCNKAALVVFVGHDTNIANLGALLGVNWQLEDYPVNGIPPASVLVLELREKAGGREVRVNFLAQPLAALHTPFGPGGVLTPAGVREHAPRKATVTAPPVVGAARFPLEE
ncbi:MAG: histidine-type phosphatase, partial [Desulfovibrio sp.]|nr:histidine-type phosphatase [Desulfovibrio sp.]